MLRKPSLLWKKSIWFFDIDDTLIDTAGNTEKASEGIREVFEKKFNPVVGSKIKKEFNKIFNLMLSGYRIRNKGDWKKIEGGKKSVDKLLRELEKTQIEIKKEYGHIRKWSREVFIYLATKKLKIKTNPRLIQEASTAYWKELDGLSNPFPDIVQLFKIIKKYNRPIFLVTGSDSFLKQKESGQFEYNPRYSELMKRKRILHLKKRGISFDGLSIGDPEDKPHFNFFQKAIKIAERKLGKKINLSNAIMVGDSFEGDLQVPKEKFKFGLVVLIKKKDKKLKIIDCHELHLDNSLKIIRFLK